MDKALLFVGNSFTARNDVPGMIAELAASRGHTLTHALISAGGASLRQHWNKGEANEQIAAKSWGGVVLQEQSTLPIKNAKRFHENVREFAQVAAQAEVELILYQTWSRQNAPEAQEPLSLAYETIATETGGTLIPVGRIWDAVRKQANGPELYDKDGSHPSYAGSYLAACTFTAVLFGESPLGLPALKLTENDATAIQQAAASVLS